MPNQTSGFGVRRQRQTPSLGGVCVVAKAVRRHKNGAAALQLGQGRDAKNELAGAAGNDDAPSFAAMKRGQLVSQSCVARVGIPRGIGLRDSRLREGTRAAGVAVGGEVKFRQTQRVCTAVNALGSFVDHCRIHELTEYAMNNIATQAINTPAIVDFEANLMDFDVSGVFGAFPDGFKV